MGKRISELFTVATHRDGVARGSVVKASHCSYLDRTCVKSRKSRPDKATGTCTVGYGGGGTRTARGISLTN